MERVLHFLPSLLIVSGVSLFMIFYHGVLLPRWLGKENTKNEVWMKEWRRKNKLKSFFMISAPLLYVYAPFFEELIFRAPIIIAFPIISDYAWLGIIISSIAFAITHSSKKYAVKIADESLYGSPKAIVDYSRESLIKKVRVVRLFSSFISGTLAGYFGIAYQSLYVSVGVHMAWNLLIPEIVIPTLFLLAGFLPAVARLLKRKLKETFMQTGTTG